MDWLGRTGVWRNKRISIARWMASWFTHETITEASIVRIIPTVSFIPVHTSASVPSVPILLLWAQRVIRRKIGGSGHGNHIQNGLVSTKLAALFQSAGRLPRTSPENGRVLRVYTDRENRENREKTGNLKMTGKTGKTGKRQGNWWRWNF